MAETNQRGWRKGGERGSQVGVVLEVVVAVVVVVMVVKVGLRGLRRAGATGSAAQKFMRV